MYQGMTAAPLDGGVKQIARQLERSVPGGTHGDRTYAATKIHTQRSLGIQTNLCSNGRSEQLIAQLKLGYPVPVGWLHHGPV
jgi:hypothetical protein